LRLLLDTHYLIWLATDPRQLTAVERQQLDSSDEVLASPLSVWEVRLKWQARYASGARKLDVSPQAVVRIVAFLKFAWATPEPHILATPLVHPLAHRDPFDEILLVQAQAAGARLLSRDALLADHPLVLRL
jgi:PIN domain nuclease of toxin-antitoxin system